MKIKISNYAFNKTSKQITFNDYTSIDLDGILLITDVTTNKIIYNFADPLLGGTVTGNVLTLTYDTSSLSDTDKLLIYYDYAEEYAATNRAIQDLISELGVLIAYQAFPDVSGRTRVNVETAAVTLTGVTTVGTVTNLGIYNAVIMNQQMANLAVQGLRNNINVE